MNKLKINSKHNSESSSESSNESSNESSSDSSSKSSGNSNNSSRESSSSEEEDFQNEVFQNDYLVLYKLGSGAFSTVWLSYQISKNEFYAIKIQNHDSYDEGILEKNCLEITSSLGTDCLIKLIESFELIQNGNKYLCMVLELAIDSAYYFLKGFREKKTGFPPTVMKKLHDNICEGLSYLHANELLHTDIKPENILVCGKDKKIEILKNKMEKIKFKESYDQQIELYKQKFDLNNKKDKLKFRKAKRNILLKIVDKLAKTLNIDEIYDDLTYLNYTEDELLQCTFKIADLGTIHSLDQMKKEKRFPCVQTRYYRAPRVILKIPYEYDIDYWSIATMYYELVEGRIMFNPHHTNKYKTDQVHLYQIMKWIDKPNNDILEKSIYKNFFNEKHQIDYQKYDIVPDKWHPDVLDFFKTNLKW